MAAMVPLPVNARFEERVLHYFQRKRRHILIGEIALDVVVRLETVEYHLEDLVRRGALRHITEEERNRHRLHELVVAYVLVDPSLFTIVSPPL